MELYKVLSPKRQKQFDAIVLSLLLRGKTVAQSINLAQRSVANKLTAEV